MSWVEQHVFLNTPDFPVPDWPSLPSRHTPFIHIMSDNDNEEDATVLLMRRCREWADNIEQALTTMGDQLQRIDVPEGDLVDLIWMLSRKPMRPAMPGEEEEDQLRSLPYGFWEHVYVQWDQWGVQMREYFDRLGEVITASLLRIRSHDFRERRSSGGVDVDAHDITLAALSLSLHVQAPVDLRHTVRYMLEADRSNWASPESGFAEVTELLTAVFRNLEETGVAEAEAMVDELDQLGLDKGQGLR